MNSDGRLAMRVETHCETAATAVGHLDPVTQEKIWRPPSVSTDGA